MTNRITIGTKVILPDGTHGTIRAREVGGTAYVVEVLGTMQRGWSYAQLTVVE